MVLLVLSLSLLNIPAFAWDATGHKLTAYIAWQHMTPEVREKVIQTLRAAPEDAQLSTFYITYGSKSLESAQRDFFMTAATWPDIIRDKDFPVRYKKYHNGNWHYSDTFWQWKNGGVVFLPKMEASGLALQKLTDFDQVLRSGSATEADKALAVVWLTHIIGDIHQPLHMSGRVTDAFQKGDQGGNLFLLTPKGTPRAEQKNLHSFWDGIVGIDMPNTKDQCDSAYLDPIGDSIIKLYPYDKIKGEVADGKFDIWAKESLDLATTEVYKNIKWFETPSDKYKQNAFKISEKRIALAGYRIADLFNSVFGTAK